MNKKILCFLFLVIVLMPSFLKAQNAVIDSINALLQIEKKDTARAMILSDLSFELRFVDAELSLKKAEEALTLSRRINFKKGEARALNHVGLAYNALSQYERSIKKLEEAIEVFKSINDITGISKAMHNIGYAYDITGETDKALGYYERSAHIAEGIKNSSLMAINYNKIGELHTNLGNYSKALSWYQKSLSLYESLKDEEGQSYALNSIGAVFMSQKNYSRALDYFNKALEKSERIKDLDGVASELNNLGIVYEEMGQPDKALECYQQSLKIKEESGNVQSVVSSYSNIAQIYEKKGDYEKAIEYNEKAMRIDEMLDDKQGMCIDYINTANVKLLQGNYQDAETLLEKALSISQKAGYKEIRSAAYGGLSDLFAHQNNYKKAFDYHQLYVALKDTILNEENSKQINEMQTKYDTEKKDKELIKKDAEIRSQQAEAKQKTIQRNGFIIGFILVLILVLFVFRSYKQKQKANIEIFHQKEIIEEKSKEITDSIQYAKRIQQALFASDSFLKKHLNEYFILYKPKDIVSGDFYWANVIDNKFVMITADCTGHGVPGAFMSLLNISYLNEAISEKRIDSPEKILDFVRTQIIQSLNPEGSEVEGKDGMDAVLCVFDLKGLWLRFACANNPLWLIRNNELKEFEADKMPVGMHHGDLKPFTSQTLGLRKGDIIYLLTDGYPDQFGGDNGKKFKYKKLKELLLEHSGKSMEEQREILDLTIEQWRGNLEQVDDILIIGIRI